MNPFLVILALLAPEAYAAEIVECISTEGEVTYSNMGCPVETTQTENLVEIIDDGYAPVVFPPPTVIITRPASPVYASPPDTSKTDRAMLRLEHRRVLAAERAATAATKRVELERKKYYDADRFRPAHRYNRHNRYNNVSPVSHPKQRSQWGKL